MSLLNRRQMLLAAGAGLLGAGPIAGALAKSRTATKKVLFFTKSSGFQHSVIARKGDKLGMAEKILTDLGKEHGFEVVASKDGRMFDPDKIGQWDAFAFETTGDLTKPGGDKNPPISAEGEKALYDAVRSGKGFMGMHCATDTMGQHRKRGKDDPYIAMIGAEFAGHGSKQQKCRILIADEQFPGVKAFGSSSFEFQDEWYALRNIADDLHVILVQDTSSMESKKDHMYARPNFPETYARMHDKGRVFYTSMGHREDVWENPKYQGLLLGALGWITGQTEIDVRPNIKKVTPEYDKMPAAK